MFSFKLPKRIDLKETIRRGDFNSSKKVDPPDLKSVPYGSLIRIQGPYESRSDEKMSRSMMIQEICRSENKS